MTHRPWLRLMMDWLEIPANGLGVVYVGQGGGGGGEGLGVWDV